MPGSSHHRCRQTSRSCPHCLQRPSKRTKRLLLSGRVFLTCGVFGNPLCVERDRGWPGDAMKTWNGDPRRIFGQVFAHTWRCAYSNLRWCGDMASSTTTSEAAAKRCDAAGRNALMQAGDHPRHNDEEVDPTAGLARGCGTTRQPVPRRSKRRSGRKTSSWRISVTKSARP